MAMSLPAPNPQPVLHAADILQQIEQDHPPQEDPNPDPPQQPPPEDSDDILLELARRYRCVGGEGKIDWASFFLFISGFVFTCVFRSFIMASHL